MTKSNFKRTSYDVISEASSLLSQRKTSPNYCRKKFPFMGFSQPKFLATHFDGRMLSIRNSMLNFHEKSDSVTI